MPEFSVLDDGALLRVCLEESDAAAWEEFVRRFQPTIAQAVVRMARRWRETSIGVLDDLIQETYLKLCADHCRLLREFRPAHPGALHAYVRVVTASVVHDHFRAARAGKRDSQRTVAEDAPGALLAMAETRDAEREVLLQEIDSCLQAALGGEHSRRDYLVFWLYYRHGFTARAISSLSGIELTTKGVESTILRLTRLVRVRMGGAPRERPQEKGNAAGIRLNGSVE